MVLLVLGLCGEEMVLVFGVGCGLFLECGLVVRMEFVVIVEIMMSVDRWRVFMSFFVVLVLGGNCF